MIYDSEKHKYYLQPQTKEILTYDPEPASCLKDPQYRLTCLFRIFTKSYHEVELKIKENLAQITHLHLEESSSAETRELPKVILFDFENFYIKNKRLFTVTLRSDTVNAEFLVKDVHTELDLVNRFSMYGVLTRLPKTYTLEKRIGKGGFGTVYLAYHLDTAKTVALKIIEKSRIMTDKNYLYLVNELKNVRRLKHPNLPKFFGIYDYRGYIGIVMEHIDGGTLMDRIKNRQISEEFAISVVRQILETLAYIHSKNILHRDIKPSNIMFNKQKDLCSGKTVEVVKLIDFGLCCDYSDKSERSLLHDKCGTVGYIAPEVIGKKSDSETYNGKADVFSLGIVLYEMLSGSNPFKCKVYRQSLNRNFACRLNFLGFQGTINLQTIDLMRKLTLKQHQTRIGVDQALDEPIFCNGVLDEGGDFLSSKLIFKGKIVPMLKGAVDNDQGQLLYTEISVSCLKNAFFRFETSMNQIEREPTEINLSRAPEQHLLTKGRSRLRKLSEKNKETKKETALVKDKDPKKAQFKRNPSERVIAERALEEEDEDSLRDSEPDTIQRNKPLVSLRKFSDQNQKLKSFKQKDTGQGLNSEIGPLGKKIPSEEVESGVKSQSHQSQMEDKENFHKGNNTNKEWDGFDDQQCEVISSDEESAPAIRQYMTKFVKTLKDR